MNPLLHRLQPYPFERLRTMMAGVTPNAAIQAKSEGPEQQAQAENVLTGALKSLFALSEAYPDLKANQNMMQLSEELSSTENRVAFARQAYNDAVMGYNNKREMFPGSVVANMFQFQPAELLKIESETKREVPKVQFT
jgi:LemA protein